MLPMSQKKYFPAIRQHSVDCNGFTLVELLVVVAVIALLLVLALPAINSALDSSSNTRSASNLKTLGGAMHLYASENGGSLPWAATQVKDEQGKWAKVGSWDSFLLPYLFPSDTFNPRTNQNGFYPSVKPSEALFSHPKDESILNDEGRVRRGYAMPHGIGHVGIAVWSAPLVPATRLAAIPAPARTLLLVENPGIEDNFVGRTGGSAVASPEQQIRYQTTLSRTGGFNYLFVDGHVEYLKQEETIGSGTLSKPGGYWTIDPFD